MGYPGAPHTFSRLDGDLGTFRQSVLDMGQLACEQVHIGTEAVAYCDAERARRLRRNFHSVRDLDMDLLAANVATLAIHHPLASDLRFMIMFSRTAYDLERINREAMKLADLAELHSDATNARSGCEMFDDVLIMGEEAERLLQKALIGIADGQIPLAIEVIKAQEQIDRLSQGALRRLATYIMQDPRNMQWVIDATIALKGLERVADHAVNIAMNLVYACSGKDIRHSSMLNLNEDFLASPTCQ